MPEVHVTVGSRIGLHARPAALLAKAAARAGIPVTLRRSGAEERVDAGSVLALMGLGIGAGEEVVLAAEGEAADAVLAELAGLVARDLDAEPGAGDQTKVAT
jgi:phosphocarrier protein